MGDIFLAIGLIIKFGVFNKIINLKKQKIIKRLFLAICLAFLSLAAFASQSPKDFQFANNSFFSKTYYFYSSCGIWAAELDNPPNEATILNACLAAQRACNNGQTETTFEVVD